jgi:hypothetical protein
MGFLDKCKTSEEVKNAIAKRVGSVRLSVVKEDLSKKFYAMDNAIEALYYAMLTSNNIVLYGAGGFGKSKLTEEFLNYFGIPHFVKVGHSGMDVEALLGIPNIKKLMEESEYKVAFEKSVFANKGALVLEEFLDVRPTVAAALKDIITEGGLREGDKLIASKIGPIIICSNKTPDEMAIDRSTAAFYKDRFPFSVNVIWESFLTSDYLNLFKTVKADIVEENLSSMKLIAEICSFSSLDKAVSPRVALEALNLFLESKSINSLKFIAELNLSEVREIKNRLRMQELNNNLKHLIQDLTSKVEEAGISDVEEMLSMRYWIDKIINNLSSINNASEELLADIGTLLSSCNLKLNEIETIEREFKDEYKPIQKDIADVYKKIQKFKIS